MFGILSALATSLALVATSEGADQPSSRDYADCLTSEDLALCLMIVSQPLLAVPPEDDFALQGADDIIAVLRPYHRPREDVRNQELERYGALGDQIRAEATLGQRVASMIESGESADTIIAMIQNAERSRPARSLFSGQVQLYSGAQMRADQYHRLWRGYVEPQRRSVHHQVSEELARAALVAWEADAEILARSNNDSHLSTRGLTRAYQYFQDEAGLRRSMAMDRGRPLNLIEEVSILRDVGRFDDAIELVLRQIPDIEPGLTGNASEVDRALMSLIRSIEEASPQSDWAAVLNAYRDRLTAHGINPEPGYGLLAPVLNSLLDRASPDQELLESLADIFDRRSRLEGATSEKHMFAVMAFDLWIRLGQPDRAVALLEHWQNGDACRARGETRCRSEFRQSRQVMHHFLGRIDRVEDTYVPRWANWLGEAIKLEIINGRGIQNLDHFIDLSQSGVSRVARELTTSCLHFALEGDRNDLALAQTCAEQLRAYAQRGSRWGREHEAFARPAAEAFIFLAGEYIEQGQHEAARTALRTGLQIARRTDDYSFGSRRVMREIGIGLLRAEGRLLS